MDNFDIVCTATLRPELLNRTFRSFYSNLFMDEYIRKARLIINVDMVGCAKIEREVKLREIKDIIYSYPFADVVPRICNEPHFGKAFVWCYTKVQNKFVFHLEEDWELLYAVDFSQMLYYMSVIENLVHLRLSSFTSTQNSLKNWNKFLLWNGRYFEVPENEKGSIGWCGHPSLNQSRFMKRCVSYIDENVNPEKQIKTRRGAHPINSIIRSSLFGCYHGQNCPPSIVDIGRQWMVDNGYAKSGNKAWFVNWEEKRN